MVYLLDLRSNIQPHVSTARVTVYIIVANAMSAFLQRYRVPNVDDDTHSSASSAGSNPGSVLMVPLVMG
jgi:hypothetical protein